VAYGVAVPTTGSIDAVLNANAAIKSAFGAHRKYFALGELGGGHSSAGTASQTSTAEMQMTVNLADLGAPGELVLGLFDGQVVGTGVTSVALSVTGDGVSLLSKSFTTAAAALAYFTDDGIGGLLALPDTGTEALAITLTVVTDAPASGFYGDFIIGDPPAAKPAASGTAARFIDAMAAHDGGGAGSVVAGTSFVEAGPRMLLTPSHVAVA
jgi:hypothetical protein